MARPPKPSHGKQRGLSVRSGREAQRTPPAGGQQSTLFGSGSGPGWYEPRPAPHIPAPNHKAAAHKGHGHGRKAVSRGRPGRSNPERERRAAERSERSKEARGKSYRRFEPGEEEALRAKVGPRESGQFNRAAMNLHSGEARLRTGKNSLGEKLTDKQLEQVEASLHRTRAQMEELASGETDSSKQGGGDLKPGRSADGPKKGRLVQARPEDIPTRLATSAHSFTSFVPEKRGQQVQQGYVNHLNSLHDELASQIEPGQEDELKEELEKYRRNYIKKYSDILHRRAGIASPMITGPANFPSRQMQKKNDVDRRKTEEFLEWEKRARSRIKKNLRIGDYPISSDDPDAIAQLNEKIAKARAEQERMKQRNKIIRNKKLSDTEKLKKLETVGVPPALGKMLMEPDFAGRGGYASYELTNNNANIRRMEARVKELERRRNDTTAEWGFEGGTVTDNVEANRLQIFFEGKPDRETRGKLKQRGFRWAPSIGAWQRHRSRQASYYAKEVTGAEIPLGG